MRMYDASKGRVREILKEKRKKKRRIMKERKLS